MAWVTVTMTIIFFAIKHTIGLRVSREEEIAGLDSCEHGLATSYAGFLTQESVPQVLGADTANKLAAYTSSAAQAPAEAPVSDKTATTTTVQKLSKVVVITKQSKLEEFMHAMNAIGVTGITVTNVLGCGVQKGSTTYYRGVSMDMNLLPKVKIEIVVSVVPVEEIVAAAKAVLHTGEIGDGKVFVYDVENVIKIRTGEEGALALRDTVE